MENLGFQKLFGLGEIPGDWELTGLASDWFGNPLLLYVEGKPPQPAMYPDMEAWLRWYRTPPKAHHVVYWEANRLHSVAFDHSQGISTFHIQRFKSGWLLGDRRGGAAAIYDANGAVRSFLDLGDASESIQTTSDGKIWVSYFDEGVFGRGIGQQGLLCFDGAGKHLFRYADFAEQNSLPMVCNCDALNVDEDGDVWLNYYTDFPLVRLHEFQLDKVWPDFGSLGKAFAIRGDDVIYMSKGNLASVSVNTGVQSEPISITPHDTMGNELTSISQRYAHFAARGTAFILNIDDAVYSLSELDQSS